MKRERTADCVVGGLRRRADRPLPSSLLLGLYDDDGALHHVGVASSFGVREAERCWRSCGRASRRWKGIPGSRASCSPAVPRAGCAAPPDGGRVLWRAGFTKQGVIDYYTGDAPARSCTSATGR